MCGDTAFVIALFILLGSCTILSTADSNNKAEIELAKIQYQCTKK